MPLTRVCSFCGNEIEPGTGAMYVKRDGTHFFFCRSKCERNLLNLRRVPRTIPWTRTAIQAKARRAGLVVEEARPEAVVEEEAGALAEAFKVQVPKGKAIPQAVTTLIDRRLGPDLSRGQIERRFRKFSDSEPLREALATWYTKRHARKRATEVKLDEYVAFLDTAAGKKVLKDWLDGEARKEAPKEA